MKLLLTAFEPFGGERVNPTMEILKGLSPRADVLRAVLPVTFAGAEAALTALIDGERPDIVLCLGQAGGRDRLTLERVALNLDDASIPDNAGAMPQDVPIRPDGENALFSTLPIKRLVRRVQEAGVPAAISNTAGTFVCNHVLYTALWLGKTRCPELRAGFLHVPYLPEQAAANGKPGMELSGMIRGVEVILDALLCEKRL